MYLLLKINVDNNNGKKKKTNDNKLLNKNSRFFFSHKQVNSNVLFISRDAVFSGRQRKFDINI